MDVSIHTLEMRFFTEESILATSARVCPKAAAVGNSISL
jgi:hypothetical protein